MVTIYHCTGSCQGTSKYPTDCGAEECELQGEPLEAYTQCEGCSSAAENDGAPHWCENCTSQD